jgi:hypothetical protein
LEENTCDKENKEMKENNSFCLKGILRKKNTKNKLDTSFSRSFACDSLNDFTMVATQMSDRLPGFVLFFIPFPANFVEGSLDFVITNLYEFGVFTESICSPELNFCLMFLYFCQIHPYHRSCQMRRVWNSSF